MALSKLFLNAVSSEALLQELALTLHLHFKIIWIICMINSGWIMEGIY